MHPKADLAHDSAPPVGGLNHSSAVRLNMPAEGGFGRYTPESGPIMLTLSFVGPDPKRHAGVRSSKICWACPIYAPR